MFKRSFYVILSSLAAASAVWALTQDVTLSTPMQTDVQLQKQDAPKPNRDILNYHDVILTTLQADDSIVSAELQVLAANDAIRSPLMYDDDDEFKQAIIDKALNTFSNDPTLQTATIRALVNVRDNQIIAASSPEDAQALLQSLRPESGVMPSSGLKHRNTGDTHSRIAWYCLNEDATYCLLVQTPIVVALPEHIKCQAANNIFVACNNQHANPIELFQPQNCQLTTDRKTIQNIIEQQTTLEGSFDANGLTYEFKKSNTNDGYTVATVVPIPKAEEIPVNINASNNSWTMPQSFGLAGGAFAIMALLGWLCVRSRKEETQTKQAISNETLNTIKEECAKAKNEKETLKKQLKDLETSNTNSNSTIKQLETQLEFAKKAFQKEQLSRMTAEQENQQLKDELASSKLSRQTAIENISHFADHPHSELPAASSKKKTEKTSENFNRITAPAKPEQLEALAAEKSQTFFDALTDDTWDDIADSFDALFTPTKAKTDDSLTASLTNGDKDLSDSFLSNIQTSEARIQSSEQADNKPVDTDTRHKPVIHTPNPADSNVSVVSKSIPTLNAVKNENAKFTTLNGAAAIQSSAERQIMPSAHDLAVKNATTSSNESFKPAPSWTGKKVTDTGMDQNSLYDALKRRARDVSEMAMPAASSSAAKSGVFDFNIGLSKSGVFSVTGSRVDIDPLSDTEYFKSLYEKYIETQKQCGEVTNKFTLEQFVSRLAREKERLMQTHHCRNVRFTVYIKEGKASLKATPQK